MVRTLIHEQHLEIVSQQREGLPMDQDFCRHVMRNEFCSRLGDEGFDVHEIAKFSGHADINTCKRYVKPHKLAHRQAALRQGLLNPNHLPGGELPEDAPTTHITAPVKLVVNGPAPVAPQVNSLAGFSPEVLQSLATLRDAGMLDALLDQARAKR
jgi:hypothetical protein